jgi:hypothetical protein
MKRDETSGRELNQLIMLRRKAYEAMRAEWKQNVVLSIICRISVTAGASDVAVRKDRGADVELELSFHF